MSHLNDGILRRMQDEPATTTAVDAQHFESCGECRHRFDAISAEAAGVSNLLAVPEHRVEPGVALLRMRRLVADGPASAPGAGSWFSRLRERRGFRPVAAGLVTLGLMGALVATGVAEGAIQSFQPKQFVAVSVNPESLNSLPDLSQFGSYKLTQQPRFSSAATPDAAVAGTGLGHVLVPSGPLPATVTGVPQYASFTQLQGSFTISADKARQYVESKGKSLPAMPAGVDGTTISVTAGPGVLTIYGAPSLGGAASGDTARKPITERLAIPSLAIVQMTSPKVVTDGASVQVLESYIASLPGVPADLAAQIQAIGDPTTTLPVPVPTGQGSHKVDVMGHGDGLFVGDSTGLGAGVIWQKDGVLYAVVGTLNEAEVVSVARSLH
ncbi:MAG: hypothetical protein QOK05_2144 [Chloroflexota bacterium]|jgi:anti-sigma factor RsiW|nr:hypothetical protein [Chloroflexota bacterium]